MIELPDRACRDYLKSFSLGVVFVTAKGAIGAGADLFHAEQPVWCMWCNSRRSAEEVLTAIGEHHPSTVDGAARAITAAADRLGIQLSSHCTVMARTKAAVVALDKRLSAAQQAGVLGFSTANTSAEGSRRREPAENSCHTRKLCGG